jgi:drug/metabolite transporter (DMT)-like permease
MGTPSRIKIITAFAAVYLIWGSTYLGIRFAIETLPPFLMAGTRFVLAGGLLYVWLRWRGAPRPKSIHWRSAVVLGGLMLLGGNGAVTWSEQWLPSGLAALLVATVPLWVVLLGWLLPGGKRPGGPVIAGLVIGLGGVALLVGPGSLSEGERVNLLGIFVILLGALSWSIGTLYSRRASLPDHPLLGTAMEMMAGGALLALAGTASGEWGRLSLQAVSLRSGLALAYLTIFGSLIAFSAYLWLIRATSPAQASTYAYVNPVVAVILGWIMAGERFSVLTLIAAAIIILAVVLITTYQAREAQRALAILPKASEEPAVP